VETRRKAATLKRGAVTCGLPPFSFVPRGTLGRLFLFLAHAQPALYLAKLIQQCFSNPQALPLASCNSVDIGSVNP
jgi:hypothetical protein